MSGANRNKGAAPPARKAAEVKVEKLRFNYRDGVRAIDGISFGLAPGGTLGIVGANGAGKSTLARLLSGALAATEGSIEIGEHKVTGKNRKEIQGRVGLVFQNPDDQLFMPTLFDDVAFGPLNLGLSDEVVRERVQSLIAEVGLGGLEKRFPGKLSGGQKKAAAIAGVLAMEPELLVLDEPSAGLDPRSRRKLMELLGNLEQTRIIISHDLEMILDLCREVMVISNGQTTAFGSPLDLFADAALMADNGLEVPYSLRRDHKHRFPMEGHEHN